LAASGLVSVSSVALFNGYTTQTDCSGTLTYFTGEDPTTDDLGNLTAASP